MPRDCILCVLCAKRLNSVFIINRDEIAFSQRKSSPDPLTDYATAMGSDPKRDKRFLHNKMKNEVAYT
jgi:ferredoxin